MTDYLKTYTCCAQGEHGFEQYFVQAVDSHEAAQEAADLARDMNLFLVDVKHYVPENIDE